MWKKISDQEKIVESQGGNLKTITDKTIEMYRTVIPSINDAFKNIKGEIVGLGNEHTEETYKQQEAIMELQSFAKDGGKAVNKNVGGMTIRQQKIQLEQQLAQLNNSKTGGLQLNSSMPMSLPPNTQMQQNTFKTPLNQGPSTAMSFQDEQKWLAEQSSL